MATIVAVVPRIVDTGFQSERLIAALAPERRAGEIHSTTVAGIHSFCI